MEINFNEMLKAVNGEILINSDCKDFKTVSIDTRKIDKNDLFFALKGENFNGNNFAIEALNKGASIVIIDEVLIDINEARGKGILIKVDSCYDALLDLANYYRKKLGIKVVGVTGSTGKTSTKDLIAAFLSNKYNVFKTKGNFNNQIGMPLMIFELNSNYDVAVLEMGMSNLGEIHVLAKAALPDIAVITNIGMSHIENLKTQDNILKAKMEIVDYFTDKNMLILNAEDSRLSKISSNCFKVKKIGYNQEYDVYATNIILREENTTFTANSLGKSHTFELPMAGKHNVLNGMLAIEVAINLGVTFDEMEKGIDNLEATSMRLQVIKKDDITIINDCYNASPDSMKSSLDVLTTYQHGRKVAILGDMYELGEKANEAHIEVGEYASNKVDLLIAIGEKCELLKSGFKGDSIYAYKSKEECIEKLHKIIRRNDVILVKASRGMKLEEVVNKLEGISL